MGEGNRVNFQAHGHPDRRDGTILAAPQKGCMRATDHPAIHSLAVPLLSAQKPDFFLATTPKLSTINVQHRHAVTLASNPRKNAHAVRSKSV
jgi:hypothetical protein